ncbi:hypothetical protein [Xanthomonas phage SB1]|uniref:Uncharacterized protein n=1 Tax=Xanthomonas phage SB1 TaxID=3117471 RepID=A0ABZ2GUD6_9CAUD
MHPLAHLAADYGVTLEQMAVALACEAQHVGNHAPAGKMQRAVELRKVVERMDVATGEMHTFVHMPGFGRPCKVNSKTTYMGDGWMFRSHIVDNILNHWSSDRYVFTLTEKEYPTYE